MPEGGATRRWLTAAIAGRADLGVAPPHWVGKGLRAVRRGRPIAAAFGVDHRRLALLLSRARRRLRRRGRRVRGPDLPRWRRPRSTAWIGVVFAAVLLGRLGNPLGPLVAGVVIGVTRGAHHGADRARRGPRSCPSRCSSSVLLLAPGPDLAVGRGCAELAVLLAACVAASSCPRRRRRSTSRFSTSCFHWVALATSWSILSGFSGYFSFGHGAFFGAGMYATAHPGDAGLPFLSTLPLAGLAAALFGAAVGAVVVPRASACAASCSRCSRLAVTFVLATIVLNTPIDGGPGVYLSAVPLPAILGRRRPPSTSSGSPWRWPPCRARTPSTRRAGARASSPIHDDEDVAEVLGVPTYRYKLLALGLSSGLAGVAGGIHAMFVTYVTVAETFSIAVPCTSS